MDIQNYYERFGQNFKNRYLYDFGINPVHLHAKSCFCSSNSVLVIFQYVLLIFSKLTIGDRELPRNLDRHFAWNNSNTIYYNYITHGYYWTIRQSKGRPYREFWIFVSKIFSGHRHKATFWLKFLPKITDIQDDHSN